MEKVRLLRITTVPISLTTLLKGQPTFFAANGFDVLTVSSSGAEVKQLEADGIQHKVIEMTRKITPLRDLVALWRLIRLIHKFKPTIVHTHTPKAGLLGMLAAWINRVPVRMHTVAGLAWIESTGGRRWLLRKMEWLTYACASRVYPNSVRLRDYLIQDLKFGSNKTLVIGQGSSNGIDADFFSRAAVADYATQAIRQKHGIQQNEFVYCFVGRIVRDKGIIELVEAFESLKKNSWLLLVGHMESDLDPLPEGTLKKIQNNPNIIQAGFQSDVRPWLAASDVFVFPSYREGFPNVVMQAACMELPCIVSDINGCNEIIQQGLSGYIVPVKDFESLRATMERMVLDKEKARNMGRTGRTYVGAHFDQQVVWQELLKEYNRNSERGMRREKRVVTSREPVKHL